jgi:hypothetical protein
MLPFEVDNVSPASAKIPIIMVAEILELIIFTLKTHFEPILT